MAVLTVACSGPATQTGSTASGAGSSSSSGTPSGIFEPPFDPVNADVVLDADKKVEAVIPVDGGAVTATGADGTVYHLEIPTDALPAETTIGLTPVASISGMPFGGDPTYAVQLSPDGLFLYKDAILTITPIETIAVDEQIVFGYLEDGKDVILASPVLDSSEIKIQVSHFSGNGVTRGLLADLEPVAERLGGDARRRLQEALNIELRRIRREGGDLQDVRDAFEEVARQYEEEVVNPRVAAAGESCAAGTLAVETIMGLERDRQRLGAGSGGIPLDEYPGLANTTARMCVLEEFELCVEQHVIHRMALVWRTYEHQAAFGWGIEEAVLREARELTIKCLTFELKFESTGTATLDDYGYDSTVTSVITLRFNPDQDKLSGEAALVNEAFEFRSPCGGTSTRGGGVFQVENLKILTAGSPALDQEVGFLMAYLPGPTSEKATIQICGTTGQLPLPPFAAWTDAFVVTHQAELEPASGGYVAIDWEVFGDEYFAKKEWIKESSGYVEAGTFKLYHTPGA
jgi:hypothetical protein